MMRKWKISRQQWNILSSFLLLISAAWIWASSTNLDELTNGKIPAPRQGFLAPSFQLLSISGETISLHDLRGQPVLINLWASWCPPCRAEMPAMQRVYDEYREQGFEILAINTTYQDDAAAAQAFVEQLGLTFPILWDLDGSVSNQYQTRAMPTSFFVDAEGIIQEVVVGGPMSEALLRIRIEQLLEGGN
jgi:cytochrome c biogenesis protein CcmG, thiol:disulfide interchange protein DsbE